MAQLEVRRVPALEDNYMYLVHEPASGKTAAVDPADAAAIEAALQEAGWKLDVILITHHHMDHIAGVPELKEKHAAEVVGPKYDLERIPDIDVALEEGDTYALGEETADIYFTPGHTSGHIAYHFPASNVLLSGDTLFSLGCGRVFEGTPEEMWGGLKKLRALPDETQIYCGHEYTLANAKFALSVDPDNEALKAHAAEVEEKRAGNEPTIPAGLGREKATNPFLRADDPALMAAMDMTGSDAVSVFAAVRRAKDNF